jgi:lactoylglutathione lyase
LVSNDIIEETNANQSSYGDKNMKLKYTTIIVKDMDESIKFYTEILGFKIDSVHNPQLGATITLLKGEGDAMIELIKNSVNEIGLYSVGMDVKDINTTLKELKSKGAKITMGPVPITVGTLAFIEDPNGAKIALIQHH